ncbi:ABC transporter permease [Nonomuraea sp. CA-218870]|uniref:ABC transporter permease n=1 Tax=Nonomuraea sp. CA-218870 TaxID=3239998 RepID=UPI003D8AE60A
MTVTTTPVVRTPPQGLLHELGVVATVIQRELIRFVYDVGRAVATLFQSVIWLLVIGAGVGSLLPGLPEGADLKTAVFPGIIAMTVILTAMFSASSIVWDREWGFVRIMLVAPVSRTSIVVGKVLAGSLLATGQGAVLIALSGLVGVPYDPAMIAQMLGVMLLTAFSVASFGVAVAARIKTLDSFLGIAQLVIMPMVFLSGALFPVGQLTGWFAAVTVFNPIAYAVDPMRQIVFGYVDAPAEVAERLNPGVSWNGWEVPVALELLMVGVAGVAFLLIAVARIRKVE